MNVETPQNRRPSQPTDSPAKSAGTHQQRSMNVVRKLILVRRFRPPVKKKRRDDQGLAKPWMRGK